MTKWSGHDAPRGDDYDARWATMAAAGQNPHGEADLVASFGPQTVLDAGCGTGRVARELARRGCATVGVDLDTEMLATARRVAPDLEWHHADLATLELRDDARQLRRFDAVVMAGNVMIFVAPGTEAAVLASLVAHLAPGGVLIAGFQLEAGGLSVADYDTYATAAGLSPLAHWSSWHRDAFNDTSTYVVAVHSRA
jgi:SAM-dependent methyltransferase